MALTISQQRDVEATIAGYKQLSAKLRAATLQNVEATWDSLSSYYDADIARFVQAVVPQVLAGQTHIAAITGAYLNRMVAIQSPGARPVIVPTKSVIGASVRGGTSPADVYKRAGVTVWTALKNGASLDDAAGQGRDRAGVMAATDFQLASTNAAQFVTSQSPEIIGYRRVLGGDDSCALCVIASTNFYHDGDLMPIHDRCSCSVEPVMGSRSNDEPPDDPTDAIASAADDIAARLGSDSTDIADLQALVIVHDHGEIGPTLAVRGQSFTGPDDIPDDE